MTEKSSSVSEEVKQTHVNYIMRNVLHEQIVLVQNID